MRSAAAGGAERSGARDVRSAVLAGFDLMGASFQAEDRFVGPDMVIRTGEYEFDGRWFMSFISRIKFCQLRGVPA